MLKLAGRMWWRAPRLVNGRVAGLCRSGRQRLGFSSVHASRPSPAEDPPPFAQVAQEQHLKQMGDSKAAGEWNSTRPTALARLCSEKFRLSDDFVQAYRSKEAPFGFNGLGELVFYRTYSRVMPCGRNEDWADTVKRVVEGTFNMQKGWIESQGLGWNHLEMKELAEEMYDRIFNFKFIPPGRGLWAMGSSLTEERGIYASLNNCAFVSTKIEDVRNVSKPFCFLMDASMLGVGVGFDTAAASQNLRVFKPNYQETRTFAVPDSREGWVEAVGRLIDSYFVEGSPAVEFDYSQIRPKGSPIKGFGGIASGSGVLEALAEDIKKILNALAKENSYLGITAIVDLMNLIGKCVVAGNVRRTAEIAFGPPEEKEYLNLKNYDENPQRMDYGWASNNSVYAELGMNYSNICERIKDNGEPGFAWLDNMRQYGRMRGTADWKDSRAMGGNPCLEQTLESFELCCLVETFPNNHENIEDFKRTLSSAYLYAKTVTLGHTHWAETNKVMSRNRRIGCSMTGIAQFVSQRSLHDLKTWCEEGYEHVQECDIRYSEQLGIPRSIKTTSIKPSGTVSLLAGATPGMHYPESRYYLRRVRMPKNSDLVEPLQKAGYSIEHAIGQEGTVVVSIPVDAGDGIRTVGEVSMWEQLSLAAFLQEHWADNQVSCTITFDPEREGHQLEHALNFFQYKLKGISFLPKVPMGAYPQMPYESITKAKYEEEKSKLSKVDFKTKSNDAPEILPPPDLYCDTGNCSRPS